MRQQVREVLQQPNCKCHV